MVHNRAYEVCLIKRGATPCAIGPKVESWWLELSQVSTHFLNFRPLGSYVTLARGRAMPDFRLYLVNELGHIKAVGEFHADDDLTAVAAVERARGDAPLELWCGSHKVKHWDTLPMRLPTSA